MNDDETSLIRTIGRYQAITELGRGAMGVVYKGYDPAIGRTVALKTIAFGAADAQAQELRRRLYVEASAAGGLTHPNIVAVHDVIEDGTTTAVVMEFVEGQTLAAMLAERGALPLDRAFTLFEQICAALDYAGAKGIVHRDIKPANILVGTDGRPKIADFGIARLPTSNATRTGMVLGSPSYMSPEQVRGLPLDRRSDLFSAATLFYEMVTLENPFGGSDAATTMYRIAHEPPALSNQVNDLLGPNLATVFSRALAKDPNQRFGTGAELVAALKDAAMGRVPAAGAATVAVSATATATPATASVAGPAPARAWQKFGLAAGVAGLAIAGTAAFFLTRGNNSTTPVTTDATSATAPGTPGATPPATPGTAAPAVPDSAAPATPAAAAAAPDRAQAGALAAATGSTSAPLPPPSATPPASGAPVAPAPAAAPAPPDAAHLAAAATSAPAAPHLDKPSAPPEAPASAKPSEAAAAKSADAGAASSGPTGTLFIDFANTFPDGSIEIEIDGRRRWSERLGLSQGVGGLSKLKLQRVSEQLGSELKVPAGDHRISVTLLNADGEVRDVSTTSVHVYASKSATLKIRLTRFKNKLQLESAAGEPDNK